MEIIFNVIIGKYKRFIWRVLVLIWYKIGEWKYSSYNAITSNKETLVARDEVLELFDNLDNFKAVHSL